MSISIFRRSLLALTCAAGISLPALAEPVREPAPRHVMVFIADGASWGTWQMAGYWEFGALGRQPYDRFDLRLGMTTMPLNTSRKPTRDERAAVGYDPAMAWDVAALPSAPQDRAAHFFRGYEYLKRGATDSAAAGTALSTGVKTYNSAINHDNFGRPLPYATQHFKALGKSTGVLTSVPFSHATPAAFGAHSDSRDNYASISEQMVANPALDVLMGTGHPMFDGSGRPRATPDHKYVSEAAWRTLTGPGSPRQLVQTREEFEALAQGRLVPSGPLLGLPQVNDTLQAAREAGVLGTDAALPSGTARIATVPSLATMTRGALQVLGRNPKGMFLMVEGGAVDWMAHANDTGRIIEEQMDFNHAVRAAVEWVERNSHWGETLMLVLTDHGNGMPMGPDSDTVAFQPVLNRGAGQLPGVRWHHRNHSNELTVLWAQGAGARLLLDEVQGVDAALGERLGHNADGRYITNSGVGRTLMRLK